MGKAPLPICFVLNFRATIKEIEFLIKIIKTSFYKIKFDLMTTSLLNLRFDSYFILCIGCHKMC